MPVRDSFYLPVQTPYSEWFLGQSKYKQVELQLKRNRTSRRISSVSLLIRQSLSLPSRLSQEDKRFLSEGNAHPINLHCVGSWVIHRLLAPYRARFSYVKHTHTHHKHFLIDGLMHFFPGLIFIFIVKINQSILFFMCLVSLNRHIPLVCGLGLHY